MKPPKPSKKAAKCVPPPVRPDNSLPSLVQAADEIGAHIVADAIDAYVHAERRQQVVWDRVGNNDDFWTYLAGDLSEVAQINVVKAILLWHYPQHLNDIRGPRWTYMRFPSCGVAYRGKIYAVVAAPDSAHLEVGETDGTPVTGLAIIDLIPGQTVQDDLADMVNLDEFFGWSKPDPQAEEPASLFGGRLAAPDDVRLNAPVK